MVATILFCLVVGVSNTDSLTARCWGPAGAETITVRPAEIIMSERTQNVGDRRWQRHPNAMCLERRALVGAKTPFRDGQTVTRVDCDGIDALAEGYSDV